MERYFLEFNFNNIIQQLDLIPIFYGLALFVLLIMSALISGSEIAFFSLSTSDLEKAKESQEKNYKSIIKLLETPKKLLATILISNNFINVGIIILSTYLTNSVFKLDTKTLIGFLIQIVTITFMILMFGEVIPKVYANLNSMKFAKRMVKTISILQVIFNPLSDFLLKSTNLLEEKLQKSEGNISVSHLEHALELTSDEENTSEEQKILEGIVSFGNTDVKQIMRARMDMFSLSISDTFAFVSSEILKNGYSRIPVYNKDIDNIKGILYIKDLLPYINAEDNFNWQRLIKPAFFVPESKKIDNLMKDFQEKKTHLAIVVDEYGGTSGLVTLEDIIEEIVGDISDEFDVEKLTYSKLDEKNYVFEGKTGLKDFYRVLDIEDETIFENAKGESDTLAGFILEIAGDFPNKGDSVKFENLIFIIESIDRKRIIQIKVVVND